MGFSSLSSPAIIGSKGAAVHDFQAKSEQSFEKWWFVGAYSTTYGNS